METPRRTGVQVALMLSWLRAAIFKSVGSTKGAIGCNLPNYFIPFGKIHTFWQCCGLYCWWRAAVVRRRASRNLNSVLFCWYQRAAVAWSPQYGTRKNRLRVFRFCFAGILNACEACWRVPGHSQLVWRFGGYLKSAGFCQTESNTLRCASYPIRFFCVLGLPQNRVEITPSCAQTNTLRAARSLLVKYSHGPFVIPFQISP